MPSESANYEAHGVLVLAREIITNGRTIHFRDIRDVRIRRVGPSAASYCTLGVLMILAGASFVCGLTRATRGTLTWLLLGGSGCLIVGGGILLALAIRRNALIVVTPDGEVAVAFANRARALEPLGQAIRSAVGIAGGEGAVPRWGSALRDAADRPPPEAEPPPS